MYFKHNYFGKRCLDADNVEIQNIIPHKYPFLLIDKILEVEPGKRRWE